MSRKRRGCGSLLLLILIIGIAFSYKIILPKIDFGKLYNNKVTVDTPKSITNYNVTCYEDLNDTEKNVYKIIISNLESGSLNCLVENIDYNKYKNNIEKIVRAVTNDHPEYYWLDGSATAEGKTAGLFSGDSITIKLGTFDFYNSSDKETEKEQLNSKINEITNKANKYSSDYEKALFVHDYIIENTEYDFNNRDESLKKEHNADADYIYTAYGCLVNGKAVCAGYSKAYQMILNSLNICCGYVTGKSQNQSHAWNILYLDNEPYFVDTTFDDPQFEETEAKKYPNSAIHIYFGITTDEILKNHTIDTMFNVPNCVSQKYNYYNINGYLFDSYNFLSINHAIYLQKSKIKTIKFTNKDAYLEAKEQLITKKKWSLMSSLPFTSISYIEYPEHYVITFITD